MDRPTEKRLIRRRLEVMPDSDNQHYTYASRFNARFLIFDRLKIPAF
jgi:hypothetical protein